MGKRIGDSTADGTVGFFLQKLSTTDNVTKYRGIPVSRYFWDGILSPRRLQLNASKTKPWCKIFYTVTKLIWLGWRHSLKKLTEVWLQAGCCKWNREAQTLHKFQQFVKWLQKLQPEKKFPTRNRNKRVLEYSSSSTYDYWIFNIIVYGKK